MSDTLNLMKILIFSLLAFIGLSITHLPLYRMQTSNQQIQGATTTELVIVKLTWQDNKTTNKVRSEKCLLHFRTTLYLQNPTL